MIAGGISIFKIKRTIDGKVKNVINKSLTGTSEKQTENIENVLVRFVLNMSYVLVDLLVKKVERLQNELSFFVFAYSLVIVFKKNINNVFAASKKRIEKLEQNNKDQIENLKTFILSHHRILFLGNKRIFELHQRQYIIH